MDLVELVPTPSAIYGDDDANPLFDDIFAQLGSVAKLKIYGVMPARDEDDE